jgi:hypothetical protein
MRKAPGVVPGAFAVRVGRSGLGLGPGVQPGRPAAPDGDAGGHAVGDLGPDPAGVGDHGDHQADGPVGVVDEPAPAIVGGHQATRTGSGVWQSWVQDWPAGASRLMT